MNNIATTRGPHPMLIAGGVALILFCSVAIAAILGWIPSSIGGTPDKVALVAEKPVAAPEKTVRAPSVPKKLAAPARVANVATETKIACASCGVIESINAIETRGAGSGLGAVGGAVVGGLLGNQIGGGSGKQIATVAGVVGGALAGNHIEKRVKATTSYDVVVRMENGSSQTINEANQPAWRNGDHVKVINGVIRST